MQVQVIGHVPNVAASAMTPDGPKALDGSVDIEKEIFYDAKRVTWDLTCGYLRVTFPFGTADTMLQGPFSSTAATVAAACASVRQWLAATIAAAWCRVARRLSIGIDIPVCLGLTLVKQTQFHLSQFQMTRVKHLHGLVYDDTCVLSYGIYRESALVHWHVEIGIRALGYRELGCVRGMSQSLSSNVLDNSPEQEAATGPSIPTRLDSSTSQAIQLPELGLTLTPTVGRELSHEINDHSAPTLISQASGPSRKRSRSPS
ncbi:hypothetical protein Tco_0722373, partial [Tanacetum coccineum]